MKHHIYIIIILSIFGQISNTTAQGLDFFEPKSHLGGYGELHYNSKTDANDKTSKTLDFHRFVIFYGYQWSPKWTFHAEVELEHNMVGGSSGELELEQAYVEYRHADWLGIQVGVILPSVGLLNEIHEPPTFLGVERPDYDKNIIPTTWFGNGLSIVGLVSGFDYKFTIMEGLNSDSFSASKGIRSGRQKGFKADAKNLLYNARIDYVNLPGIKFGGSFTFNNASGDSTKIPFTLIELHARYRKDNFYMDAEFGNISYDTWEVENAMGCYINLGYDFSKILNIPTRVIPFIRYSDYSTAASTLAGGDSEKKYHMTKWMFGLSVLPIDEVSFKIDYSIEENELTGAENKLFNIGMGYMF